MRLGLLAPMGDDWRDTLDDLSSGESVKVDVLDGDQTTYFFLRVPKED